MILLIIGSAAVAGAILLLASSDSSCLDLDNDRWPPARDPLVIEHEKLMYEWQQVKTVPYKSYLLVILYVHAFALFVARYRKRVKTTLQTALFNIRQVLMTTLFGVGHLHG